MYCVLDLGSYPVILLFVCKFGIVASAYVCTRQAETLGPNYTFNFSELPSLGSWCVLEYNTAVALTVHHQTVALRHIAFPSVNDPLELRFIDVKISSSWKTFTPMIVRL